MAKQEVPKKLSTPPPPDHAGMDASAVLKKMRRAAHWSMQQIADAGGATKDSVKNWESGRTGINVARPKLLAFIRSNAASAEIAEAWCNALIAALERRDHANDAQRRENRRSRSANNALVKSLKTLVLEDRQITRLPALFETDLTLPLAHAYVELRIAPSKAIVPTPGLLEQKPTLAEHIKRRSEQRFAVRRSPRDVLDQANNHCSLILGAPGAGKSSLLRKLALDIADGEWKSAAVPLFVEARAYAAHRREQPSLTLIDYACQRYGASLQASVRDLLTNAKLSPEQRAILLVDGLDEIAADADAVHALYGTLANSTNDVMWIATARPAGLMAALNEHQRYEMVELDADAIDRLIENWCAACETSGLSLNSSALRRELDRVPGIREMSTNPFLLTALCFLKSTEPQQPLPNSRISVYEILLERIAHQAQARHRNPSILSAQALADLSTFACHLYSSPNGQIFRETDWNDFAVKLKRTVNTDFERQILPARLLTACDQSTPQYHFLHLTLHEYLVARSMLDWPVTETLKHRLLPWWRSVFRFYGALLWHRSRSSAFAELVIALFQMRDVNDLQLITLAEIFSDAGLRDTTRHLGVDLRESLLSAAQTDNAIGTEAFLDALALIDPDWLTERTIADMTHLANVAINAASALETEQHYPGHIYVVAGRDIGLPYIRLARARTATGARIIEEAFWGKDPTHAILAANAYADIATPTARARVLQAALEVDVASYDALKFYAFSLASRRKELLPFLRRFSAHIASARTEPFGELLELIADIGGTDAREVLSERLLYEFDRSRRLVNQIGMVDASGVCMRAIMRLPAADVISIVDAASAKAPSEHWSNYLEAMRRSVTPSDGKWLARKLKKDTWNSILPILSDAAMVGRLPDASLLHAIRKRADMGIAFDIFDLAVLERLMLEAGSPPQLCAPLLSVATAELQELLATPSEYVENRARALQTVLEVLGIGRWAPATSLIRTIIENRELPTPLREAAIAAYGRVLESSDDAAALQLLETILYDDDDTVDGSEVTLAIGRISLERLFERRGALHAMAMLQQVAAENDYLIFETFWVDRSGSITKWKRPPRKILYAASPHNQHLTDAVAHEMSRFGLVMITEGPADACVAALTIEPLSESDRAIAETDIRILAACGGRHFRIRAGVDVQTARELSRTIGAAFE